MGQGPGAPTPPNGMVPDGEVDFLAFPSICLHVLGFPAVCFIFKLATFQTFKLFKLSSFRISNKKCNFKLSNFHKLSLLCISNFQTFKLSGHST